MIRGNLSDNLSASIRLKVLDAGGLPHEIEASIDTGFNGFLLLAAEVVSALGLRKVGVHNGRLADGTSVDFEIYLAKVIWNQTELPVAVVRSGTANLLGMSLLENSRLAIDVVTGGEVTIETLPPGSPR